MTNTAIPIIRSLLASPEPSLRFKTLVNVLGEEPGSPAICALQGEIKQSSRVRALLADRDERGRVRPADNVYKKWFGAHWVLATLADIGYPAGDVELQPIVDQVLDTWTNPEGIREHVIAGTPPKSRVKGKGVPIIEGRARRCASQQANGLYAAVTLGFVDDRCRQLVDLLVRWQWPDGGWNCDRKPEAFVSSFWESLLPLRALARYAEVTGDHAAQEAAERAAEVFLTRRLFRRRRDGAVMNEQYLRLHYPCYWRYDILCGLKVLAEAGFLGDERCGDALDLLASKQLPDGGWPAEERFYRCADPLVNGCDRVDWGGVSKRRSNPWVTVDALAVLGIS